MKSHHIIIITALALSPFAFAAEDSEKPVKLEDVPAAVAKAIKAAVGDAKLKELKSEKEDGVESIEAVWEVKGRVHEITVGLDGTVLSEEEIIPLDEAPAAVQAAIRKEAGDRKIIEVERVKEKGKTLFEAVIKTAKGKLELKLDEAGKELGREEGAED